jgi:retron-type reverse transcriptase
MKGFNEEFLTSLKKSISGLYDRDKRLKMNGDNFWIIEKDINERFENLSGAELT